MKTYWLLSKSGFPYHVDLQTAEDKVERTKYWRQESIKKR